MGTDHALIALAAAAPSGGIRLRDGRGSRRRSSPSRDVFAHRINHETPDIGSITLKPKSSLVWIDKAYDFRACLRHFRAGFMNRGQHRSDLRQIALPAWLACQIIILWPAIKPTQGTGCAFDQHHAERLRSEISL